MTSESVLQAARTWAASVVTDVGDRHYDHIPTRKSLGLPDLVIELRRTGIAISGGERFAAWDVQQAVIRYYELGLSFMVDNSDTAAAATALRGYENDLTMSVLSDPSLGSRVDFVSPLIEFDFTAPFVEYADGTRGREMSMTMSVGELVEATR